MSCWAETIFAAGVVEKRRVGVLVWRAVSEAVAFAAAGGLEKLVRAVLIEVVSVLRGREVAGLVRNLAVFIFSRARSLMTNG
jgi:hypothetical protein